MRKLFSPYTVRLWRRTLRPNLIPEGGATQVVVLKFSHRSHRVESRCDLPKGARD